MATIEVTNSNIEEVLTKNDIVVLDFWANWCGPCKRFGPIFEKVASRHPEIVFGKVNTENEAELSGVFSIMSIPTLMIFRENIVLFSQPGALPEDALEELIDKIKNLNMDEVKKQIEADDKNN